MRTRFEIPEEFSEETRKAIQKTAELLINSDRWNDFNVSLLNMEMNALEEFLRMSERIDKEGVIVVINGRKMANPAFNCSLKAAKKVLFASRLLGGTPLSRKQPTPFITNN